MDDDAAPREEGVPVAVHKHALHDGLRQVAGPGATAAHLPRWPPPHLAAPRREAPLLPQRPQCTQGAGSPPETNEKLTNPQSEKGERERERERERECLGTVTHACNPSILGN
uniref:Kidney associated antigen 1 n=1 Tax=Piliocolobus tephrosceles TaxID=591936 RepID=A0A8C9GKY5_9PRIM